MPRERKGMEAEGRVRSKLQHQKFVECPYIYLNVLKLLKCPVPERLLGLPGGEGLDIFSWAPNSGTKG